MPIRLLDPYDRSGLPRFGELDVGLRHGQVVVRRQVPGDAVDRHGVRTIRGDRHVEHHVRIRQRGGEVGARGGVTVPQDQDPICLVSEAQFDRAEASLAAAVARADSATAAVAGAEELLGYTVLRAP